MTSPTSGLSSSTHADDASQQDVDMSTQEHDQLWKKYLEKATSFDQRIIEDWNKIVDVTLVFVGIIIAVLASFIIDTSKQFQPNPADVTNQLLTAIYDQLLAQANNSTPPPRIQTDDILKVDLKHALICNSLLYGSLGLCSVAAMLALAAKLWVTSYSERISSGETPHQRAMARQKAYSGVLVWRMGAMIQSLPLILLIALIAFGFFVHVSIWKIHNDIGYGVGTLFTIGVIALGIVSLAAAFIPECPYNSSFSTIIDVIFQCIRKALKLVSGGKRQIRMIIVIILWFASGSLIAFATITSSSTWYLLVFIPIATTFEYATFVYPKKDGWNSERQTNHKGQKYRLPRLTLYVFIVAASLLAAAGYFHNPQKHHIFIALYVVGMLSLLLYGFIASKMSQSLDVPPEINAIAWLLKLETSPNPDIFMTLASKIRRPDFRPKILDLLMPLLSRLIVSHCPNMEPDDLKAYTSCLAYLADFKDDRGSWWLLWEDARYHPTLEEPLREKLVKLADHQAPVGEDAKDVLRFHGLDAYGKKLGARVEKPRGLKERQISGDAASMGTFVESAHSYEAMELHPRWKGGYHSVDV